MVPQTSAPHQVAEMSLERWEANATNGNAATTVANLMIRAVEEHMRSSNWSATSAIAAPSQLGIRYGSVTRAAANVFRTAADDLDHHGAHYSLALLYKLYPTLVAPGVAPDVVAAAPAVARSDEFAVDLLRKRLRAETGAARGCS